MIIIKFISIWIKRLEWLLSYALLCKSYGRNIFISRRVLADSVTTQHLPIRMINIFIVHKYEFGYWTK